MKHWALLLYTIAITIVITTPAGLPLLWDRKV